LEHEKGSSVAKRQPQQAASLRIRLLCKQDVCQDGYFSSRVVELTTTRVLVFSLEHGKGSSGAKHQRLVQAYPGSLQVEANDGSLPLHCAFLLPARGTWQKGELARYLLHLFPAAAQHAKKDGMLPLHVACGTGGDTDTASVDLLVQAYPGSLKVEANDGALPLNCAFFSDGYWNKEWLVKILLRNCPGAAGWAKNDGMLPSHMACGTKGFKDMSEFIELVNLLVTAYPQTPGYFDDNGLLPFHHACIRSKAQLWVAMVPKLCVPF